MLKFKTFEELLENEGLKKKAAKSGISYGTLKKVYNRGMAAWRTGHRPGTTPQQWGMARVNSYIGKGKGTYYGADADLRGKSKKEDVNEVSKDTLQKYHKKSQDYMNTAIKSKDPKMMKNVGKRLTGAGRADNKLKSEATVKEISKGLAKRYIGKAARDVFHKGRDDATQDAIGRLGGTHPDQNYKKGPERKAAMRVRGIDRATNRLAKKEAMSDAEKAAHQKAIDAFKAKGGKIKKLKPGYAQGYHGKSDPGAGMKGMISPADTKQFGTKKKVGSMK